MTELTEEELKFERKRAAHFSLFFGGLSLALGAIICLIYLLIFKPWVIKEPQDRRTPPFSRP